MHGSDGGRGGVHPRQGGFLAFAGLAWGAMAAAARADTTPVTTGPDSYLTALLALDRHEIAALALTLGVLCFAVVTAILLLRTRERAARMEAAFRDEIISLKAEIDRVNALLLSEPQIIASWAAADNEP